MQQRMLPGHREPRIYFCCPAGGLASNNASAGPQQTAKPTTLSSWVSMMPGGQILTDTLEDDEPLMPGGLNLVVMGPPLVGKSVQAQLLSERYQLVVTTLDNLLMVRFLALYRPAFVSKVAQGLSDFCPLIADCYMSENIVSQVPEASCGIDAKASPGSITIKYVSR